ncbi:MAG: radical SAM protein [Opitutae bacterium]|nr:radical SAM protein [Opitutae bacterium]
MKPSGQRNSIRVLSVIPPMTQLNTPYPATAWLTGFLRSRGVEAVQEDFALALARKLFSRAGLEIVRTCAEQTPARQRTESVKHFLAHGDRPAATVDAAVAFLQGRDPTLARRIGGRRFLPEGPRFQALEAFTAEEGGDPLAWAFGALGAQDRAKHVATLFLNDLADVIRDAVDGRFEFARYAESLAKSQPSFDPLAAALAAKPTRVEEILRGLVREAVARHKPDLVLVSVPFPGCVHGAFRIAQAIKELDPRIATVLGGGFVNTELRELSEPRAFDFFDFVTLDDGERPALALVEHLRGERSREQLVRTFVRKQGKVQFIDTGEKDIPFAETGTPTWDGLPLDRYISVLDMLNPMHRLWSDGRWNKLAVAHGCYWRKCAFCDTGLDSIARHESLPAEALVDRIEAAIAATGQTGFHFTDEAAPPAALKALAAELKRRKLAISWWGNIRFEKAFTPELCRELAESGCLAVSGGLEAASDRLLRLMNKGVSVEQVARVAKAFSDAGILVHAYLMYGFPTQTAQETVDSLEYVRQLVEAGCIQSGFFHRFACTVHSPVGRNPEKYGIELLPLPPSPFAKNDVEFVDPTGVDHAALGTGLAKALYNYMHGVGLAADVRSWFGFPVPRTAVKRGFIARAIRRPFPGTGSGGAIRRRAGAPGPGRG